MPPLVSSCSRRVKSFGNMNYTKGFSMKGQKEQFFSLYKSTGLIPLHEFGDMWEEAEIKHEEGFINSGGLFRHATTLLLERLQSYV